MNIHDLAGDLDRKIAAEEASITAGIAEAHDAHLSMHDGYWKRIWALRQKRKAVQVVLDAFSEAAAE